MDITEYLPLVDKIARQVASKVGVRVSMDDLRAEGAIGLMEATKRYDPSRPFKGFAAVCILDAMKKELRFMDHLSGYSRKRVKDVLKVVDELTEEQGQPPTALQVAEATGLSERVVREIYEVSDTISRVELSEPIADEGDGLTLQELIVDEDAVMPDVASELNLLKPLIATLPESQQRIIELHYYEGLSYSAIAEEMGVSKARVGQIHNQMLARIRKLIGES